MKKTIVKVKGMHCKSCEMLIKDALEEEKGVSRVNASYENGEVIVIYDHEKINENKIKSIIKEEGFEV
jgi:copper chaperone CopZ